MCVYRCIQELWAATVTQTEEQNLEKSTKQQKINHFQYLVESSLDLTERRSTYWKLAYATVQTFRRMDYLLCRAQQMNMLTYITVPYVCLIP